MKVKEVCAKTDGMKELGVIPRHGAVVGGEAIPMQDYFGAFAF